MTNYYNILFSIDCYHNYYQDGYCRDLLVEPTEECRGILNGYRLLFKQRHNGGIIISEQKNTGTESILDLKPKVPLEANTVFTFKILLKNPLFLNITETHQNEIKPFSVFVFYNEAGSPSSVDGTTRCIQVHNGPLAGPVQAVGKVFRHNVDLSRDPVLLAVYDEAGLLLRQIPINPTMPAVHIDLNGYPEGTYELRSFDQPGSMVESREVFVSNDFLAPHLIGFLQVRYTNDILDHPQNRHNFTLEFENRSINWTYKINVEEIEPGHEDNLDLNNIQLVDPPTTFSKSMITADSQQVIFSSDHPIELKEQPYKGIQLKNILDGEPEILVKNMPNPGIDRLVKDGTFGLRSEMYLTIK